MADFNTKAQATKSVLPLLYTLNRFTTLTITSIQRYFSFINVKHSHKMPSVLFGGQWS